MAKKPPKNGKKKSIEQKIQEEERKLQKLRMLQLLEESDHPKEAKHLMKTIDILRNFAEEELAEQVSAVVADMIGLQSDDDEDTE